MSTTGQLPREIKVYLGGTFNPIHIGHARLLLECQLRLNASQAYFVPSALPPHKPEPELSSHQRLVMAQKVADELNDSQHSPGLFQVESCELSRDGPSYTVDTLRFLREKSPSDCIVWVIGMDSLVALEGWHQWQELTRWANLLVVNRPGWSCPKTGFIAEWVDTHLCSETALPLFGGVAFMDMSPLDISSSDIRQQLKSGLPTKYLLPEPVLAYIQQHGFYFKT